MDNLCPDSIFSDTFFSILSLIASTSLSSLIVYKFYRSLRGKGNHTTHDAVDKKVINETISATTNGIKGNNILTNGNTRHENNSSSLEEVSELSHDGTECSDHENDDIYPETTDENDGRIEDVISKLRSISHDQFTMNSRDIKTSESDLDESIEIEESGLINDESVTNEQSSNENISHNTLSTELNTDEIYSDDLHVKIMESVVGFINSVEVNQPVESFASFAIVDRNNFDIKVVSVATCPKNHTKIDDDREILKKFSRIALNDTRSLTIARRSFLKYVYSELSFINEQSVVNYRQSLKYRSSFNNNFSSMDINHNISKTEKSTQANVIEKCSSGHGYQVKPDLDIYLILSKSHVEEMENERKLRKKETKTVESSLLYDKLLQWSCLGVQGSVLSHLIKPIYIRAIIVPSNSKAKRLHSSISRKFDTLDHVFDSITVNGIKCDLTDTGFQFNPPDVVGLRMDVNRMIRTPTERPLSRFSTSSSGSNGLKTHRDTCISMISLYGNSGKVNGYGEGNQDLNIDVEYIYVDTGCAPSGHSSKLSKSSLFDDFGRLTFNHKTLSVVPWSKFYPSYPLNYLKVKNSATIYKIIKNEIFNTGICSNHNHEKDNENNFNAFDPK